MKEIIERNHMLLFAEKYIVGKVLNDFSDHLETSPDNVTIVLGYLDVNQLWLYDCRGNKSNTYILAIDIE